MATFKNISNNRFYRALSPSEEMMREEKQIAFMAILFTSLKSSKTLTGEDFSLTVVDNVFYWKQKKTEKWPSFPQTIKCTLHPCQFSLWKDMQNESS